MGVLGAPRQTSLSNLATPGNLPTSRHPDHSITLQESTAGLLHTEVTDDPRYLNSNLSVHPYSRW